MKRMIWLMFRFWIVVTLIEYSECKGKYSAKGNNVCSRIGWFETNTTVPRQENVKVPRKKFCISLPFICTYEEWETKIIEEVITVNHSRTIRECCEGYENVQGSCIPTCNPYCRHGECIKPNTCFCDEGWAKPLCLQECDDGHYGSDCLYECQCMNGATCDKKDGSCLCSPGYTGDYCQDTCPANVYGASCSQECKCKNDAVCNSIDGSCDCEPGFTGRYCEDMCQEGSHGKNCEEKCVCLMERTDTCHHVDGECICLPGYVGTYCEDECEHFTYGTNCSKNCSCITQHTSLCDPSYGFCMCEPGWKGDDCSEPCPVGKFGQFCKLNCSPCPTPAHTCNPETGFCDCMPGRFGDMCHKNCPDGWWGTNCTTKCNCTELEECSIFTGECISLSSGGNNTPACPDGYWGENCTEICKCYGDHEVHHDDREIMTRCDRDTGHFCDRYLRSPKARTNELTSVTENPQVCPDGWWGLNCTEKCNCNKDDPNIISTKCDRMTGGDCMSLIRTQNVPDYITKSNEVYWKLMTNEPENVMEPHQDPDCGPYYYGPQCKFLCSCSKEEICDSQTGACSLPIHKEISVNDMSRESKIAAGILIPILCLAVLAAVAFLLHFKGFSFRYIFGRPNGIQNLHTSSCAASTDYIAGEAINNPMYGCTTDDVRIPLDGPHFERGISVRYSKDSSAQAALFNQLNKEESRKSDPLPDTHRSSVLTNLKRNSEQGTKGPAQDTSDSTSAQLKGGTLRSSMLLNNLKSVWSKENATHGPVKETSDTKSAQFEDDFLSSALESIYDENHQYETVPAAKEKNETEEHKKAN